MIKFYYDDEFQFPIWINRDMVVSVEPDKHDENYTHIKMVNGYAVVYGLAEDVIVKLRRATHDKP